MEKREQPIYKALIQEEHTCHIILIKLPELNFLKDIPKYSVLVARSGTEYFENQ